MVPERKRQIITNIRESRARVQTFRKLNRNFVLAVVANMEFTFAEEEHVANNCE
jgi:hypothetical protein